MKNIYKAAKGAQFTDKKAQIFGEFIDRLSRKTKNSVDPDDIINAARDEKSPIHDFFEWDDSIAAEMYRKHQARHMISHINVIVVSDGEEKPIRAFMNVEYLDKKNTYVPTRIVAKTQDLRSQIIKKALDEEYKELDKIFGAIKEVQKKLKM